MLDIGFQELLIVMVIALLVFGPYKLPELGRALGRAMREFRRASDEFRSTIETNLNLNEETILPPSAAPDASATAAAPTPAVEAGEPVAGDAAGPLDPAPSEPAPLGAGGDGEHEAAVPLEPFWGQRGGRLLHRSGCGWAARIPEADRVVFKTAGEGRDAGLSSCPVCDPRDEAGV